MGLPDQTELWLYLFWRLQTGITSLYILQVCGFAAHSSCSVLSGLHLRSNASHVYYHYLGNVCDPFLLFGLVATIPKNQRICHSAHTRPHFHCNLCMPHCCFQHKCQQQRCSLQFSTLFTYFIFRVCVIRPCSNSLSFL